jgi:hypothetical protein
MSSLIQGNNKHLTLEDRQYIEKSLNERMSFREISKYLCKDPSTISKEVMLNRSVNTYHHGSFVSGLLLGIVHSSLSSLIIEVGSNNSLPYGGSSLWQAISKPKRNGSRLSTSVAPVA